MTDGDQGSHMRLPDLGPRGEGWVAIQVVLLLAAVTSGAAGPQIDGTLRVLVGVGGLLLIGLGFTLAAAGIVRQRRQLTVLPRPSAGAELVVDGPYALVRHPMYGGIVIAAYGWAAATASLPALVVAGAITVFFDLKARREEVWLDEQFTDYAVYRAHTRRLVPWIY